MTHHLDYAWYFIADMSIEELRKMYGVAAPGEANDADVDADADDDAEGTDSETESESEESDSEDEGEKKTMEEDEKKTGTHRPRELDFLEKFKPICETSFKEKQTKRVDEKYE